MVSIADKDLQFVKTPLTKADFLVFLKKSSLITSLALSSLSIYDNAGAHSVQIKINETQAANRVLNLVLGASDRSITLSGNPTLGDWFNQSVKTTDSVAFGRVDVDNLRLDGNTLSSTDASGNLLLDTNGGSIAVLDNMVCGASGTALTSGFTTSRSSNPRIWLYETGASANNRVWEQLANSGTYRFRVSLDDLTNSVSIYNVTRSGIGSLVFEVPTATVTISSLLNVDNLRLDGNTLSSTNSSGDIYVSPNGSGIIRATSSILTSGILYSRNDANDAYSYSINLEKSTNGGNTADGAELGYFNFKGYANSNYQTAGRLIVTQDGSSSGSNVPGKVKIQVNDGSSGMVDAVVIGKTGLVELKDLKVNKTPSAAVAVASTHEVAINFNGTTYNVLLRA